MYLTSVNQAGLKEQDEKMSFELEGGRYGLTYDQYQWALWEKRNIIDRKTKKEKEGEEKWKWVGYYPKIEGVFKKIIEVELKKEGKDGGKDTREILKKLNETHKIIENMLLFFNDQLCRDKMLKK